MMIRWAIAVALMPVILCASSTDGWNAAGGFGLTVGAPGGSQILVSPQLEYAHSPRVLLGPLIQVGISSDAVLAVSGTVRYLVGDHARIRPSFEAGIGFGISTSPSSSSPMGILLHGGMGVDYQVDPNFAIGTFFRLNLAPPIVDFFVSWPVLVVRFAL